LCIYCPYCQSRLTPTLFHPHPTLPHIPSFPTRRSSDLIIRSSMCSCGCNPITSVLGCSRAPPWSKIECGTSRNCTWISVQRRARSEEHTSELQSRENLVCRLLLEKKNRLHQV